MKKIITKVGVVMLIGIQVSCSATPQQISKPLDQVKFEKSYKYAVDLKTGTQISPLTGDQMEGKSNQLILKNKTPEETIMAQSIDVIYGKSTVQTGNHAVDGMITGGLIIGIPTAILFTAVAKGLSDWGENEGGEGASAGRIIGIGLAAGAIGAISGGVIGLGIGALIPKYDKVEIRPIVSKETNGVNVGLKF